MNSLNSAGKTVHWKIDLNHLTSQLIIEHEQVAFFDLINRTLEKNWLKRMFRSGLPKITMNDGTKYYSWETGFWRRKTYLLNSLPFEREYIAYLTHDFLWREQTAYLHDGTIYLWKHKFLSGIIGGIHATVTDSQHNSIFTIDVGMNSSQIKINPVLTKESQKDVDILVILTWVSAFLMQYKAHSTPSAG